MHRIFFSFLSFFSYSPYLGAPTYCKLENSLPLFIYTACAPSTNLLLLLVIFFMQFLSAAYLSFQSCVRTFLPRLISPHYRTQEQNILHHQKKTATSTNGVVKLYIILHNIIILAYLHYKSVLLPRRK